MWKKFNHFYNDSDFALVVLPFLVGFVSTLFMFIYFFTGFEKSPVFQSQLISAVTSGLSLYLTLDIWIYIHRTYNVDAWAEKNLQELENSISPAQLREAKQVSKKLLKMLKGKKHREQFKLVSAKLQKLVTEEVPRLLANEKMLAKLIADAEETIKKETDNGIIDGEEQLMKDSKKDLHTLQQRLEDTKKKIELILCFLNHFSIRLSVLVSADTTAEVEHSLFEVQQDLDQMLRADEEVAQLHAKYVESEISARKAADEEVNQVADKLKPRQKIPAG